MIRFVAAAVTLSFGVLVVVSTPLRAERAKQKRAKPAPEQHRVYDDRDRDRWYPSDSNQLKFGSRIWLEQMEREGRFGGSDRSR